ncbi:MAG: enoyl-CoA hydratase-related protein [Desulfomonilaceae bacterium]|nr:enoyl-CoA hydratase-related protein [Desulfomonilaceae bacterium]
MVVHTSMQDHLASYHREESVGFITLNRPAKRNALNLALWNAIDQAVAAAEEDRDARVIVVRGAGKSFCAGLDLSPDNELIPMITTPPTATQKTTFYKEVKRIQAIHTRLERLPLPTIAAIHGHCLGAGLELVLCCDIRLCSEDTVFGLPEARLAIITDVGGLQRLPKVVGQGHAREIAFRGHRFDAARALAINLVNDVYPDTETLHRKAEEMAREIAANPPLAVQGAKDVFLFNEEVPLDQALDYNAARSSMILPSEDVMEAMAAHLQKREGKFKGA